MRVGIVGAGPAGLSLATALLTLPGPSIDVSVYDRADALKTNVGGGLQLSCGAAALKDLGIDITNAAVPVRGVLSRQVGGRELLSLNVQQAMREAKGDYIRQADLPGSAWQAFKGTLDAPGDACFAIMRDSLQSLLAAPLPPSTLQLGKSVSNIREVDGSGSGSGGATLSFDDGSPDETVDLVVGCDGINSKVKSCCFPDSAPSAYSGVKVLFAIAPSGVRPSGSENTFHQWLGDGAYALSASYGSANDGGDGSDMLALCYADESAGRENDGWDTSDALKAVCQQKLAAAKMPPEVVALSEAAGRFYETSVYFRQPSVSWSTSSGSAVLCGDAAHAMPPFLGQGANQAILDAVRLARELKGVGSTHTTTKQALDAYQRSRWFPTARLLANSRVLGFLETQRGPGALFRDGFFFTTGKLGVAKQVFLDGAMMKP